MNLKIGKTFIVFRSSEDTDPGGRIPIFLGQGRAFGSGEHETTFTCLEELENISVKSDTTAIDVGCGTGILSIAAAKMGARHIVALDTSSHAIKATMNNIRLNHMGRRIVPMEGELKIVEGVCFDLIMANLFGDILITLMKDLHSLLNPGGYLLLSGILFEDAYELKTGFVNMGYQLLKARYLEEYVTMVLKRNTE